MTEDTDKLVRRRFKWLDYLTFGRDRPSQTLSWSYRRPHGETLTEEDRFKLYQEVSNWKNKMNLKESPQWGGSYRPVTFYKVKHKGTGLWYKRLTTGFSYGNLSPIGEMFVMPPNLPGEWVDKDGHKRVTAKDEWEVYKYVLMRVDYLKYYDISRQEEWRDGVEVGRYALYYLLRKLLPEKLFNDELLKKVAQDHFNEFIFDCYARMYHPQIHLKDGERSRVDTDGVEIPFEDVSGRIQTITDLWKEIHAQKDQLPLAHRLGIKKDDILGDISTVKRTHKKLFDKLGEAHYMEYENEWEEQLKLLEELNEVDGEWLKEALADYPQKNRNKQLERALKNRPTPQ